MTLLRHFSAAALPLLLAAGPQLSAQSPSAPGATSPHNTIFLDAAHGGSDTGAQINDRLLEKDLTVAFAGRLRSLLIARGFNVVLTRDESDTSDAAQADLSTDQRAAQANRIHPLACFVLHFTASGVGVHIVTSALPAPAPDAPVRSAVSWSTAQSAYLAQSNLLATQLDTAIQRSGMPLVAMKASAPPLDSLQCPAIAVELAPLPGSPIDPASVSDGSYQQRVAEAIAGSLIFWRSNAELNAPVKPAATAAKAPTTPGATTAPKAPTPVKPPATPPAAAPGAAPIVRPAPVVRKPAPAPGVTPPATTPAPATKPPATTPPTGAPNR